MKTIKLFSMMLILSFIIGIMQVYSAMTANEYRNIIGRGLATDETKNLNMQTMNDIKDLGYDNIRIRVGTHRAYTSAHLNAVVVQVENALAAGLVPIVAWNNSDQELRASEADRQAYLAWWRKMSEKLANHSDKVAFNLMLEISSGSPLRDNMNVYKSWCQSAIDIIRADNPKRIIILSSPNKKATSLATIPSSLYQNDDYIMAEWHLYASGPNHKTGGQKEWRGDGNNVGKDNVDACIAPAIQFTEDTGIPTWFGALMTYSQAGIISDSEARNFTTYMLKQLSEAHIPWTVNAMGNLYDDDNHKWTSDLNKDGTHYNMNILNDIMMTTGDFLWGSGGSTPTAPAAPDNLSASATSCSKINLSWSDNANNEDNYLVKQQIGTTYSTIATLPANTTSYSVTNLDESTTYKYKVLAKNATGTSSGPTASATSPACGGGVGGDAPAAPTNVVALVRSSSKIVLKWADNADNEDNYIIERKDGTVWKVYKTLSAGTVRYVELNLKANTTFKYKVYAKNAAGESAKVKVIATTLKSAGELSTDVAMYPNPTSGIVNIAINEAFTYGTVKIVNTYGATIETKTITNQEAQVNLQNYNAGLYFIVVSYNNTIITKSVVKN